MSVRVQVILDEKEAARFRSQAVKEAKSLSAWLREAGRQALDSRRNRRALSGPAELKEFFDQCRKGEAGREPDWDEHKEIILKGFRAGPAS